MVDVSAPVVAICVPVYDHPKTCFWRSLNALWKPSSASVQFGRQGGTHTLDVQGYLIEQARRFLTAQALAAEPKATHLLFIDDDMQFPPHALKRLLSHDQPIVGGLCHSRRPPYHPILCRKHEDPERKYGFCYHYPPDALFNVDVTGGAFVLIKREVFEAISEEFGAGTWWDPFNGSSEDFSFFERAKACGFQTLVDTGLEIGHLAEVVIYAEQAKKLRAYQWEPWNPDPGVKTDKPRATVVVPTYNQKPKYLKSAVLSASHQTAAVEVVIVDDGSDEPVSFEGWPENVRVIRHVLDVDYGKIAVGADKHQERKQVPCNRGIAAALNTGIAAMQTDWFCWLSSDDVLDPRKVELQLAALRQCGGQLSFHRYQVINPAEPGFSTIADMPHWSSMDQQRQVLSRVCAINGSTIMVHKNVFTDIGGFDEEYRYGQDYEFFCRAGDRFFWYSVGEILGTRREGGNLTALINATSPNDEIRLRRDAEDTSIRARYAWPR